MSPDVVVVGGGVIGCACASELARGGASVVLLERATLGAGASGRNHGLILVPPDPALLPMARWSLARYLEVSAERPWIHLDADPIGYLIVAGDQEAERTLGAAEAEAVASCGVEMERVDASGLRSLEPGLAPGLAEGWLLHDGRRLDPAALTVALAQEARDAGAEVRTGVTVRSVEPGRVIADDGVVDADAVVVATGPWTAGLLRPAGIEVPVTRARGWLVHLRPSEPVATRLIERAGWHLLPGEQAVDPLRALEVAEASREPDVGTLLQPNADGSLLVGGSRQVPAVDEPEDHEVPREMTRRAIRLAPALAEAEVLGAWWGLRPMSMDALPLVGRVGEGMFVATGHGSQGVILAAGTGALVVSLVRGTEPPFDPSPFDPGRTSAPGPAGAGPSASAPGPP